MQINKINFSNNFLQLHLAPKANLTYIAHVRLHIPKAIEI